jgi:hypothetical protein
MLQLDKSHREDALHDVRPELAGSDRGGDQEQTEANAHDPRQANVWRRIDDKMAASSGVGDRDDANTANAPGRAAHDDAPAPMSALPPEFLLTIQQVPPEVIGAVLREHPELAAPILAAVRQLRGNAVAQAAVASATSAPLHKRDHEQAHTEPVTAPVPTSKAAPVPSPTKAVDAEHAKNIERGKVAAWNQLAYGTPDERSTPTHLRLPPNIVQALEKTWQDTLATKVAYEQGGNLVKHYSGGYGIRRKQNDSPNLFDQDDNDVGRFDTVLDRVLGAPPAARRRRTAGPAARSAKRRKA